NVPQIFKSNTADPRIFHDILWVIDCKKPEAKIADVQDHRRQHQQQKRDRIRLPRSRNYGRRGDSTLALLCLKPDLLARQLALLRYGSALSIAGLRSWMFLALTHLF